MRIYLVSKTNEKGGIYLPDFETSLNGLLVDIFNSISKYEEKSLKSLSNNTITFTEAHILEAIAEAGSHMAGGAFMDTGTPDGNCDNSGVTVSDIAAAMYVAVPTATVALKKLESKGLISKTVSPEDGRRNLIRLTELGMKMNRAHMYFHKKLVKNVSKDMTEDEKEILLSATSKLGRFLKEKSREE